MLSSYPVNLSYTLRLLAHLQKVSRNQKHVHDRLHMPRARDFITEHGADGGLDGWRGPSAQSINDVKSELKRLLGVSRKEEVGD